MNSHNLRTDDPLTVDRSRLIDIKVEETIKDGKSIWRAAPSK